VDRVVSDLENPFSGKNQSMQEIAEEKNKQSRILLLGICRSAKEMLLSLQKSVPNSSMPALWQTKLDAARKEYLAFAEQINIPKAEAEAELARELGEIVEDAEPETPVQSPDDAPAS
jgi:hypothetical protein